MHLLPYFDSAYFDLHRIKAGLLPEVNIRFFDFQGFTYKSLSQLKYNSPVT
jgi:hypothetical protein